jgi:hypothetical protein
MKKINDEIISHNFNDFTTPGVVVELSPEEAESLGAFEETAISEEDAIESVFDAEGV